MATCPQCGRALEARHRCRGVWRLRLGVWRWLLTGAVIGTLAGLLMASALGTSPSPWSVLLMALVGLLIAWALRRG